MNFFTYTTNDKSRSHITQTSRETVFKRVSCLLTGKKEGMIPINSNRHRLSFLLKRKENY